MKFGLEEVIALTTFCDLFYFTAMGARIWMSNYMSLFDMHVITYPYRNVSKMQVKEAPDNNCIWQWAVADCTPTNMPQLAGTPGSKLLLASVQSSSVPTYVRMFIGQKLTLDTSVRTHVIIIPTCKYKNITHNYWCYFAIDHECFVKMSQSVVKCVKTQ